MTTANSKRRGLIWLGVVLVCVSASIASPFTKLWERAGVRSAAFSPDERLIVAGNGSGVETNGVLLLDARNGSLLHVFEMGEGGIWDVQFSPDGRLVAATAGRRAVSVYDVDRRVLLYTFTTEAQGAAIAFAPDSSSLAIGDGNTITLYAAQSGQPIRSFGSGTNTGPLAAINTIAFLPDGKSVVSGSGARGSNVALIMWDVETGQPRWSQKTAQSYGVGSVSVSKDGNLVSSASEYLHFEGPLQFWDAQTGELAHTSQVVVQGVAFSPQEPVFLTVSANLALWEMPSRRLIHEPGKSRLQVRFNGSGQRFLTAGTTLAVFDTPLLITRVELEDSQLTMRWIGPSTRLRVETSDLRSPWTTHSEAESPVVITLEEGAKFFRLVP